jgi:stage III sporulation protein AE
MKQGADDIYKKQTQTVDTSDIQKFIDELNGDTSDYIPSIDFNGLVGILKSGKVNYSIKDLINGILKYLLNDVLLNTKLLAKLVVLAIICAILQNMEKAFDNDNVSNLAYYACFLILIIIVVRSFSIAISIGRDTINRMVDFMLALMPTLLTLLASAGGFASASIFDPIIMATVQIISNIVRDFILPIIFLTSVLSIVNNLSDTFKVSKLASLLRQVCVWTLGFTLTIFIGIITIRGATSQTLDQVAVKTVKFAVDNFIPIVGKCLSDAVSTIAGYTLILKDAISTVGLIALVITCIFPLIKIISMILIYKLSSVLIEPVSDKRIVNCLNDVGNAMTMIFASVVCVAVMFFIMVTIIASTGKIAVMSQ